PTTVEVLHRNPVWAYTYPTHVARDRSGTLYLGMRSAVARLVPSSLGYREDWLVPKACRRRGAGDSARGCGCTTSVARTPHCASRITNAATDSRFIESWQLRRHSYLARLQLS